jgi:hypothetical protein
MTLRQQLALCGAGFERLRHWQWLANLRLGATVCQSGQLRRAEVNAEIHDMLVVWCWCQSEWQLGDGSRWVSCP